MDPENYRKYTAARMAAAKGSPPDTSGLTHDQANEVMKIYEDIKDKEDEQRKKAYESYAELTKPKAGHDYRYAGIGILVLIVGGFWIMDKLPSRGGPEAKLHYSANDIIPAGQIKITRRIYFYNNEDSTIGEFKRGISADSIAWFLKRSEIEKAPIKGSWSGAEMRYLKNFPQHWVKMYKGKKNVKAAWFIVRFFNEFDTADSATYKTIRMENF